MGLAVENHAVGADWGDINNDGDLESVRDVVPGGRQADTAQRLFRNDGVKGSVNLLTKGGPLS